MTYEEAKIILDTYKLPMTSEQLNEFKAALRIVNCKPFKLD